MARMPRKYHHVIGFDDAPFDRAHRGDVLVVGTVFTGTRLEGVLSGKVRRDGVNATRVLAGIVRRSRFRAHVGLVLLQGIALAGFNVVDIHALARETGLPVLVVMRRRPRFDRIRRALLENVRGGRAKLALIEAAGPVEPAAGLFVQRAGIALADAAAVLKALAVAGRLPEPLRAAHLIAGGIGTGESRHRA
ncbi:MAG: DUF99 family protein [Burkholderiales bacterium]|nr:DUF99 family protein [Burkholderiales bacterium]